MTRSNFFLPQWARPLLAAAVVLMTIASSPALAQVRYIWIDDKGVKTFSDQPPPASVPPKRILKAPGGVPAAPSEAAATPAAATDNGPAKPKTPAAGSLAEREADYIKRRETTQKDEQKALAEAQRKRELDSYCGDLRDTQRTLASGVRVASTDRNGERSFISEQERSARSKKIESDLKRCN